MEYKKYNKLYNKEYKLYDYGDGVGAIQTILNKLGLYSGPIHSFMDEETVEALKEFQKANIPVSCTMS